jgi:outer membrane protein assembly factor BamB
MFRLLKTNLSLVLLAFLIPVLLYAKRTPPKPVAPVTGDGVTYGSSGDGFEEFVVATQADSGKELWKTKIFAVQIKSGLEKDVQAIFITKLKLTGPTLYVRDESARCFQLELKTQAVESVGCAVMKKAKSTAASTHT